MDWSQIVELVWSAVNSPAGITFIVGAVIFLLNKLYAKKPGWKKFEGLLMAGVKHAEKAIPDGTENTGLRKFDAALKFVLKVYTKTEGKLPSVKLVKELKEGINLVHDKLEGEGKLK